MPQKTLALNMIVGPGDGLLLDRCLRSIDAKKAFDEIVLVPTTSDPDVLRVCEEWGTTVVKHPWTSKRCPYGDFAAARNVALENTTADFWMWLDADDVFDDPKLSQRWENVRKALDHDKDIYLMSYTLKREENGEPSHTILRERIIKRRSGIRWMHPCHEQLDWMGRSNIQPPSIISKIAVVHAPEKPSMAGVGRNLKILYAAYSNKATRTRHIEYYYARDLIAAGRYLEALPIMAKFIDGFDGSIEHVFEAAMELATYYIYDRTPDGTRIRLETLDLAESYLRIALNVEPNLAEVWCVLGDLFSTKNKVDDASRCYKQAMTIPYGRSGVAQTREHYTVIPTYRLAVINYDKQDYDKAFMYLSKLKDYKCMNDDVKCLRRDVINKLYTQECMN